MNWSWELGMTLDDLDGSRNGVSTSTVKNELCNLMGWVGKATIMALKVNMGGNN